MFLKKSSIIIFIMTIVFILGSCAYTTWHRIQSFEAPQTSLIVNKQTLGVELDYDLVGLMKTTLTSVSVRSDQEELIFQSSLDNLSNFQLTPSFSPQPESITYVIKKDDTAIYHESVVPNVTEFITAPGDYEFVITWDYNSTLGQLHDGHGMSTFKLHVFEKPVINLSQTSAKPGEFIKVTADTSDTTMTLLLSAPTLTTSRPFQEHEGQLEAYVPIDYLEESEQLTLTIHTPDEILETHTITLEEKIYDTQHLIMPEETADATLTEQAQLELDEVLSSVKGLYSPTRYFEDEFKVPHYGVITTDFGLIRYTNDHPIPRRHPALDIAAPTGTKIKAVASGKIVVSRFLQQTGHTLIIDHGLGLLSYHYHLDTLNVEEGDFITQGELIGTVGTTGYSTGPHLHFAITLQDHYLDPWFFFDQEGFIFL